MTLALLSQLLAVGVAVAFAMISAFMWNGRDDRIMGALFLFFAMNTVIFSGLVFSEAFINIPVLDPTYGSYRPVVIRGLTLLVALGLVWRLYRR